MDSFYSQPLGKLLVGVYDRGLIGFIDHHARLGTIGLLDIAHLGIVHWHLGRFRCLAVCSRQDTGLLQGAVGHLPSFGDDDDMGARDLLGVEPDIIAPALPQSQAIILNIVAPYQDREAVIRLKAERRQLFLLLSLKGIVLESSFPVREEN